LQVPEQRFVLRTVHLCTATYICSAHRNLRTRTSIFALAKQFFGGKNWLISTLAKIIYFKEPFFRGLHTKPLFTSQNRLETFFKKIIPFVKHTPSSIAPRIYMASPPR
jgi:hypothetical protein